MNKLSLCISIIILTITGCSKKVELITPQADSKVIVLLYHRIVNGEANNLYERSIDHFIEDLEYLKSNNIKVLSFKDLINISDSRKMPSGNCAIICFDDGDYSWYSIVMPLLLQNRMKATFFLWVANIGRDSFLSWNEVELMSNYILPGGEKPFRFESHSFSHPYLMGKRTDFSDNIEYNLFLDYELKVSKDLIETHTQEEVTVLALPFGDGYGDDEIINAAKRNGYKLIRTSKYGVIKDPVIDLFIIPCLTMLDNTSSVQIGHYLNIE